MASPLAALKKPWTFGRETGTIGHKAFSPNCYTGIRRKRLVALRGRTGRDGMDSIRVCIVEDDDCDARLLREALDRFTAEQGTAFDIAVFHDGADIVERYPADTDIVFLDIEMGGLDGLSTARTIRAHDGDVLIFFVTNMIQFALEGYTVNASAYIVKPLRYPLFRTHMQRAIQTLEQRRERFVTLRSGREHVFVNSNKIMYVETSQKRSLVHTDTNSIFCNEALQAIEKKLDPAQFFRVHASFLVNLAYVDTVMPKDVVVRGTAIPISKHRKHFFMKVLADYKGQFL